MRRSSRPDIRLGGHRSSDWKSNCRSVEARLQRKRHGLSGHMQTYLTLTAILSLVAAAVACGIAFGMNRFLEKPKQFGFYRALLAVSLIPHGLTTLHMATFSADWVSQAHGIESSGYYPGVLAYIGVCVAVAAVLLAAGLLLARRLPLLSAFLPIGVFSCHYGFGFDFLDWRVPEGVSEPIIDSSPIILFGALSISGTVFLLVVSAFIARNAVPRLSEH